MRSRTAMFESWRGRYADSPRALSERLAADHGQWRQVWVGGDPAHFPDGVEVVRRHGPSYFRRLFTSDLLVTNDIVTRHLVKGPRVTYVQAWHGTPLKLVGLHETRPSYPGAAAHRARMLRDVATWDFLVSPAPVVTEIFRGAFGYDGRVLETGYPRNDVLCSEEAPRIRRRVRDLLGVGPTTTAVLYAPTWRDHCREEAGGFGQPDALDVPRLRSRLPEDTVILTRMHANVRRPPDFGGDRLTIDVSGHPEIAELYLASDVLVSDYSSAVYDYAVTGKPIVLYAYDLEEYRDTVRGLYFDYETWAPGPVVETVDELADALCDLPGVLAGHRERYARFVETFCPHEDGHAGERVLAAVLASTG